MSSVTKEFKIGDVVQVGSNGEKGKIIDIIRPLGTYCMYKVHMYFTGNVRTAAKHELVKGLPDQDFQDLFECYNLDEFFNLDEPVNDIQLHTPTINMPLSSPVPCQQQSNVKQISRFAPIDSDPKMFRAALKNKNTDDKTKSHVALVKSFLSEKGEHRQLHLIPPIDLDTYLQEFVIRVRQKNGDEYEPSTIRGMIGSLDR